MRDHPARLASKRLPLLRAESERRIARSRRLMERSVRALADAEGEGLLARALGPVFRDREHHGPAPTDPADPGRGAAGR